MFLKKINDYTYQDLRNDGEKNTNETDINDRNSILYVGLTDEEFEEKKKQVLIWVNTVDVIKENDSFHDLWLDARSPWDMLFFHVFPRFFAMFESFDAYKNGEKPIFYLAISKNTPQEGEYDGRTEDSYNRVIALQSEVEGFEDKKIAAFLVNRMNSPCYHDFDDKENREELFNKLCSFDGQLDSTITASADEDFEFRKCAYGLPRLSKVEMEVESML